MPKKFRFRGLFDKQHGKRAEALLKSASQQLYHNDRTLPRKLSLKKSLLLARKISGLLLNTLTLTADEKYPVLNRDNLTITVQMILSQKQKTSLQFFAAFLKSNSKLERFETKGDPHSFCIYEITDSENVVR